MKMTIYSAGVLFLLSLNFGCTKQIELSADDIEVVRVATRKLLDSDNLHRYGVITNTASGRLAVSPRTIGWPTPGTCVATIDEHRPELARQLARHLAEKKIDVWPEAPFNVSDLTLRVSHLTVLPDIARDTHWGEHIGDAYWSFEDIEPIASRYPGVVGYVRIIPPINVASNRVFFAFDFGPTDHSSDALCEAVKSNGQWRITWIKFTHWI